MKTHETRTSALLACGAVGAPLFVVVLLVEGALRPGYDPLYQPGSALSLGDRGWIQIASFLITGLLMVVFAIGVRAVLGTMAGIALGVFGLSLIVSGVFPMDAMRGYPPGTPLGQPAELSLRHQVHDAAGLVVFLALAAACMVVARRLTGASRAYSLASGVAVLVLFVWFGASWSEDAAHSGVVQRILIVVGWTWITLLSLRLLRGRGRHSHRRGR
jgi:hypothetical protein